jgi:serine protease Do
MRPARSSLLRRIGLLSFSVLSLGLLGAAPSPDAKLPPPPAALTKAAPENVEDLKAIQEHVKKVLERVVPATVGLRIGGAQGSGVIISKDGYVLTAGHVSGASGRDVTVILPDGKTVKGKTLGRNALADSGLVKITEERDWSFVEMGDSGELQKGQWCIAVGHPGGYKQGRTPVVRVGRVHATGRFLSTDCALVGGDSGGPLFDMNGKVIGIHSRIGGKIESNMHVPVNIYKDEWVKLTNPGDAYLGVELDSDAEDCKIGKVRAGTAAEKAGLKADDIITRFDGFKIEKAEDLRPRVEKKRPGDEVAIEVRRGEETLTLKAKLGQRE